MTSSSRVRSKFKINKPPESLDIYLSRQFDAIDQQGLSSPLYDTSFAYASSSPYVSRIERKDKETQITTAPCCRSPRPGQALPPDIAPSTTMGQYVTREFEEFCQAFHSTSETATRVVNPMRQLLQEAARESEGETSHRLSRRWSEVPADRAKVYMARRYADQSRTEDEDSDRDYPGLSASPAPTSHFAASTAAALEPSDSSQIEDKPHLHFKPAPTPIPEAAASPSATSHAKKMSRRPPEHHGVPEREISGALQSASSSASQSRLPPKDEKALAPSEPSPSEADGGSRTPTQSPAKKKASRTKSSQSLRTHSKSPSHSKSKRGGKTK